MKEFFEIKTVNADNVNESGFFCYMSKRKEPGYKQKRDWLEARFAEGMKIKILHEDGGATQPSSNTSRANMHGAPSTQKDTWSSTVFGWWEKAKARDMEMC